MILDTPQPREPDRPRTNLDFWLHDPETQLFFFKSVKQSYNAFSQDSRYPRPTPNLVFLQCSPSQKMVPLPNQLLRPQTQESSSTPPLSLHPHLVHGLPCSFHLRSLFHVCLLLCSSSSNPLASPWLSLTRTPYNSENADRSQPSSGLPLPLEYSSQQSFQLVSRSSLIGPCLSLWLHLLYYIPATPQRPSSCENTGNSSLHQGVCLTLLSPWGTLVPTYTHLRSLRD